MPMIKVVLWCTGAPVGWLLVVGAAAVCMHDTMTIGAVVNGTPAVWLLMVGAAAVCMRDTMTVGAEVYGSPAVWLLVVGASVCTIRWQLVLWCAVPAGGRSEAHVLVGGLVCDDTILLLLVSWPSWRQLLHYDTRAVS